MEHVRGRSVAELLREGHRFDIEEAVAITLGVLSALAAAHQVGILHRDVKPANVLLPDDGGVKLADFGIAKAMGDATTGLTATGIVIGTASYLAPELVEGRAASPASDVYSVGCMLHELLTGAPPFVGDSAISVAYAHTRDAPRPVTDQRPEVPQDLAAVVARSLAKDPADRFPSAEAMSDALIDGPEPASGAAATVPLAAGVGAVAADSEPSDARTSAMPVAPVEDGRDRPGFPLAVIAGVAALVVVAAVLIALLRANGEEVAGEEPGEQGDTGEEEAGDTGTAAQDDPGDTDTDAEDGADTAEEDGGDTAEEDGGDPPPEEETPDEAPPVDETPDEDPAADGQEGDDQLGSLMGRLASAAENEFGDKQEDLLDGLREVNRASDRAEQVEKARSLREEIAEWVDNGEIDQGIAGEADAFLAQLIAEG